MYSILAHVTTQPQHVDEFIALNRALASASVREEPGTLSFDVIQDETTPNHFFTHETYVDAAAFQAHMQGDVIKRYGPQIIPLLIGVIDDSIFLGRGTNITPGDRA